MEQVSSIPEEEQFSSRLEAAQVLLLESLSHAVIKFTSGRWIMTVVAALVFAYTAIMGILPPEDAQLIIALVFTFYFNNKWNEAKNGNGS